MTETDQMRIAEARHSFTGRTLTDSQFDESWQLAGIIERGIRRSGTFKEKLGDYSYAFARAEQFDPVKGETIIRDMFKARYGQSMNEMREKLMERESAVRDLAQPEALGHARGVVPLIRDGETMPFYRAFDHEAGELARKHRITESGAKSMMKEAYEKAEGRDLYRDGKAAESEYHLPKREAEKQARDQARALERKPERARA